MSTRNGNRYKAAIDLLRARLEALESRVSLTEWHVATSRTDPEPNDQQQSCACNKPSTSTDVAHTQTLTTSEWNMKIAEVEEATRMDMTQQIDRFGEQRISRLRNENKKLRNQAQQLGETIAMLEKEILGH